MKRRVGLPILIVFFPAMLIVIEAVVAVSSYFLLIHTVGGSEIPLYIRIPLFLLCAFVSPLMAVRIAKKNSGANVSCHSRRRVSLCVLSIIALHGVYGYLRLLSTGGIVFKWDAVVNCCDPTGLVSGTYIVIGSVTAMLVFVCYTLYRS